MFQNEKLSDFNSPEWRADLVKALQNVRLQLPRKIHAEVAGQKTAKGESLNTFNPSNLNECVSVTASASLEDVEAAIQLAVVHQKKWGEKNVQERMAIIMRAAEIMCLRRAELVALICIEVGKSFVEADAEVAEAIDYCRYYATLVGERHLARNTSEFPGESNIFGYRARGLVAAITPWNFPFAIACGMVVAPLLCGNAVFFKPAEQANATAHALYKILREAGVPGEVLAFLPGDGEIIGEALVLHPRMHVINFTGSRAVGLGMLQKTAAQLGSTRHIKKVVAEMGGKNAIIVDADADLDEALLAILSSAFGFAGQKCSALSRVLVHQACAPHLLKRLKEAVLSLIVGRAEDLATQVGPVIDAVSKNRLDEVVQRHHHKIVAQAQMPQNQVLHGHYVLPTLLIESDTQSELMQRELFGPLLSLYQCADFAEAIKVHNDVDYALTAGVFSRLPSHIELARKSLEAGNIYINREITGAYVGRQPFGGYKLSGVGAKAGGPDYLLNFLEAVTITEYTLRHGFVPE